MTKPSIVFAHGLWADGSCFGKLIPKLQAEGFEVMASQHGLDSLATDVTAVKACLARVGSPAILVRRAALTADGRILQTNSELYPASRFRYSLTLHRAKPGR